MKAYLKLYRQSPRKVRLAAKELQGKGVEHARLLLGTMTKRASGPLVKLLNTAVANAKQNNGVDEHNLFIKEMRVDQGPTLKRFMPRARGVASPIRKRTSNISVVLEEQKVSSKLKASAPAKGWSASG